MGIKPFPKSGSIKFTNEGGIGVYLKNKTGALSVKGSVVEADDTLDLSIKLCGTSSLNPFGIVYENGIADGNNVLVVLYGIAEILVNDSEAISVNDWAGTSDTVSGRGQGDASPPAAPKHDQEIGHFIESKTAGTNVLVKAVLHYR